jgi:hypothetical protein
METALGIVATVLVIGGFVGLVTRFSHRRGAKLICGAMTVLGTIVFLGMAIPGTTINSTPSAPQASVRSALISIVLEQARQDGDKVIRSGFTNETAYALVVDPNGFGGRACITDTVGANDGSASWSKNPAMCH